MLILHGELRKSRNSENSDNRRKRRRLVNFLQRQRNSEISQLSVLQLFCMVNWVARRLLRISTEHVQECVVVCYSVL